MLKSRNKSLILVLLILALALLISKLLEKDTSRNFQSDLFRLKNSEIEKIEIYKRYSYSSPIQFFKTSHGWQINYLNRTFNADSNAVLGIINTIDNVVANRVVTKKSDNYKIYEVNDSVATRVILSDKNGKSIADAFIGKFSYQKADETETNPYAQGLAGAESYIRLASKPEVYSVKGFLGLEFDRDLKYFRDPTILNSNYNKWK